MVADGRVLWLLHLGPGHGIPVITRPCSCGDGVMIELVGWAVKYIHRSGHRNHLGAVIVQFHSTGFILHRW